MSVSTLIPRTVIPEILHWLPKKSIILLLGSRQVGKTSVMLLLKNHFKNQNVPDKTIPYFTLDDPRILDICSQGSHDFVKFLTSQTGEIKETVYCFLDEIQYLQDPSGFLKLIADQYPQIKLIVSGSSTLQIRQKFQDSLAGRKIIFEIYPLDFLEYLRFKGRINLLDMLSRQTDAQTLQFYASELSPLYEDFCIYGGYPEVVLEDIQNDKIQLLLDIYNSYIRKDIKDIARIENPYAFNNLLRILALQIGSLSNINSLTKALKINRLTLERYLFLLENTFIINRIPAFFTNRQKEIVKMPKVYFEDTGLRNLIINNFNPFLTRSDLGEFLENAVYSQISKNKRPLHTIHFWRTQSKNEVDFIIRETEQELIPIEVKYQAFNGPDIPSGLKSFINDYTPKEAFVLTRDYFGQKTYLKTQIHFTPCWAFTLRNICSEPAALNI